MTSRLVRTLALAPVLSLAACAADASSDSTDSTGEADGEGANASTESQLASPRSAYSFFVATKAWRGYALTRLNGLPMRCANGRYDDTCPLDAIDLSATGLSVSDAQSVLDDLGRDAHRSAVVLLGNVTIGTATTARSSTLRVQEIWRAPSARPIDGDVLHVSHATSQALWVNDWSGVRISSLAFAGAPKLESCALENGMSTCSQSYDRARVAAASATGLLAVGGVRRDGTLVASQYFLRVSIGDHHSTDGFAFCKAAQAACDSGSCFDDPVLCHAQTGTGRGQFQAVRFDVPIFRTWLLATSQTVASDYPTP